MSPDIRIESFDHRLAPPHAPLIRRVEAARSAAERALPNGLQRPPAAVAGILVERSKWLAQFARVGEGPDAPVVGFKLGYAERSTRFYSWLGGVDPDFRRRGIARQLMVDQHRWCTAEGFELIETSTTNRFRAMLLLNLRMGFDVVGTRAGEHALNILLAKSLKPRPGITGVL